MAEQNELGLFQTAMLQNMQQPVDPIQQLAKEFAQKDNYFRQLLGNDIIDRGMAQYGPQFFTLLEQQLLKNPELSLRLQGTSGQSISQQGLDPMNTPAMLNARLGVEQNGFRGGASTILVKMPDGSFKEMPRMYDVGYSTNALGGNVDIGANYIPKDGQMPKAMYNIQARYNKKF